MGSTVKADIKILRDNSLFEREKIIKNVLGQVGAEENFEARLEIDGDRHIEMIEKVCEGA